MASSYFEEKFLLKLPFPCGPFSFQVLQAKRYIEENFSKIRNVTEVSAHLGLNYHTLRGHFRRELCIGLKDYLVLVRIFRSLNLLLGTNKLIKEIAWEVGFREEGQMVRTYRRYLDTIPQIIRTQDRVAGNITKAMEKSAIFLSKKD